MTHSITHHDQNSNMTHRVASMTHHSSLPDSESLPVTSSLPQQSLPVTSDQSIKHVTHQMTHHVTNLINQNNHVINPKKKSRDPPENEEKGK